MHILGFFTEVKDFGKIISTLLETLKELGENVEKQKMSAIGTMNLLKSITKQRENDQAKLQVGIFVRILPARQGYDFGHPI